MFNDLLKRIECISENDWAREVHPGDDFWDKIKGWINESILPEFAARFSHEIDEIIRIDPDLNERAILENVAMRMVQSLEAINASVRIYDPDADRMLSFGSYPEEEETREAHISLENSISGEVLRSGHEFLVPNIMKEDRYLDKTIVERKGANSLLAIPFEIPSFFPHERNTVGVIQIYFSQVDRTFTPLEVRMAKLMAGRLGFVIAKKKILSLQRVNEKKEKIVRQIFRKLGSSQGVKMKDIFNRLIPELVDIINLQNCALFSVSSDRENVVLEAGYPDSTSYHGIGKSFPVHSEPAFEIVIGLKEYTGESHYEKVTPSYAMVIYPQKSTIISDNIKQFARNRNINSILYIPLNIEGEVTHFMTFDALEQRKGYTQDEIEILLFLGRELMKAQRMERLDDILHDFKNPAIAIAGFAKRVNQILEKECSFPDDSKISRYLNILMEETSRLQEMSMSISHVGKEQRVNLAEVVKRRYEINTEAIREQLKENVIIEEGAFTDPLWIRCYPLHIERVVDNILNNATNAIPYHGGTLGVSVFRQGEWAWVEVRNSGEILEEDRRRILTGDVQGRGFYITHRMVRLMNGRVDIRTGNNMTMVSLRIPVFRE